MPKAIPAVIATVACCAPKDSPRPVSATRCCCAKIAFHPLSLLKRQPLSRQVIAVAALLLLPLFGAIVWSALQTRRERQTEVRAEALSVAVSATASLDEYLQRLDAMASVLVRTPVGLALDRTQVDRLFADLLREQPLLANIVLATADGGVRGAAVRE